MDFKDFKPFESKTLEEDKIKEVISVNLSPEERSMLDQAKKILEQDKDSTALKQLAFIGFKSITSQETSYTLSVIFANKRRNKRLGIGQFEL